MILNSGDVQVMELQECLFVFIDVLAGNSGMGDMGGQEPITGSAGFNAGLHSEQDVTGHTYTTGNSKASMITRIWTVAAGFGTQP